MGQRPILKDGAVVNVAVFDDDTAIVTKAEHKRQMAAEDADYQSRVSAWRADVSAMQAEVKAVHDKAVLANMTAEGIKAQAATEKNKSKAASYLQQILSLEGEVKTHMAIANKLAERPYPSKPKLVRAKRWFHHEGLEVGPAGGDIGDLWDGKRYTKPSKAA